MMNDRINFFKNVGTLALLAGAACASVPFAGNMIGGVLSGLFVEVSGDIISEISLKKLLKKSPSQLNHDLEKMIVEAVKWTIKNIEFLYVSEFANANKKLLSIEINSFIAEIDSNMSVELISSDIIIRQIDNLDSPDGLLDTLFIEVDNFPAINDRYPFPKFFKDKFSSNFQLCFGELLKKKENRSALIVYNRNVHNNIRKNIEENRDLLIGVNDRLDHFMANWGNSVNNNTIIPELDNEINGYISQLKNKIDLLVDQNGQIIERLDKIDHRVEEHTGLLEGIKKIVDRAKVKIQNVEDKYLKIIVNEQMVEIPNSIESFKKLMEETKTSFFQFEDNIHDINKLSDDLFNYLTGNISFNQILTKQIIEAIKTECNPAARFYEMVKSILKWENETRISDKAKEIISYSFVGLIGKQFSKLMAIGKEDFTENKQKKYIEKCNQIVKSTLDLVIFAFISQLWDDCSSGKICLCDAERQALKQRFNMSFEPSFNEQLNLLVILIASYKTNSAKAEIPIPELNSIYGSLVNNGSVYQACMVLGSIQNKKPDKLDCYKAETNLAIFFNHFNFLAKYRMVSMKRIGYRKPRYDEPRYLHRYVAIGIDNKANVDAEKINFTKDAVFTDAVLLFKGDNYKESVNLFPFVLDYNALTNEKGSKICFFHLKPIATDSLEFLFQEDNSLVQLEKKGIMQQKPDVNDVFLSNDDYKTYNIDCVVDSFIEVQKCLTGDVLFFDDL